MAEPRKIVVTENGPYEVFGEIPVSIQVITPNKEEFSWDWVEGRSFSLKDSNRLCRCGHSKAKPFCDDSHFGIQFDGKETASRLPYAKVAEQFDGPSITLHDAENLCAAARFCDAEGKIWSLVESSDQPKIRELVIREAMHCPSGRLVLRDKKMNKEIEHALPPSIGVVEDPALQCSGPLWIRGGITIESSDGTQYEPRNRVTLCRCGASTNKPFCDGSHVSIKFQDGLIKK